MQRPFLCSIQAQSGFYESMGSFGIQSLAKTVEYIKEQYPRHLIIADAKRGDIGNTSDMYAKSFFQAYGCGCGHGLSLYGRDVSARS